MPQADAAEFFKLDVIPLVSSKYPPPITVTTRRRPRHIMIANTVHGRCHHE